MVNQWRTNSRRKSHPRSVAARKIIMAVSMRIIAQSIIAFHLVMNDWILCIFRILYYIRIVILHTFNANFDSFTANFSLWIFVFNSSKYKSQFNLINLMVKLFETNHHQLQKSSSWRWIHFIWNCVALYNPKN